MTEITPERAELISKAEGLWERGFSASEIGDRLGVSKNLIAGIARGNSERFPSRSQSFISAKIAENNKKNSKPRILAPQPTKLYPAKGENEFLTVEIKKLRDAGMSTGDIAVQLRTTKSRIAGIMYRNRDIFPATKQGTKKPLKEQRKTRSEIYQDSKARKEALLANQQKRLEDQVIESAISRKAEEFLDKSLHDVFVPIDTANSKVITTLTLKNHMCKYPIGQSKDIEGFHFYCGANQAVERGSPYCLEHHKLCYTIPVRIR